MKKLMNRSLAFFLAFVMIISTAVPAFADTDGVAEPADAAVEAASSEADLPSDSDADDVPADTTVAEAPSDAAAAEEAAAPLDEPEASPNSAEAPQEAAAPEMDQTDLLDEADSETVVNAADDEYIEVTFYANGGKIIKYEPNEETGILQAVLRDVSTSFVEKANEFFQYIAPITMELPQGKAFEAWHLNAPNGPIPEWDDYFTENISLYAEWVDGVEVTLVPSYGHGYYKELTYDETDGSLNEKLILD